MRAGHDWTPIPSKAGHISIPIHTYYEGETQHPPGSLLVQMAKALGVTTDELLGAIPIRRAGRPASTRLQRRLSAIEKLDTKEKRQILAFLDTFIEREQLKKKAEA